jgi:hypothetical protein
MQVQLWAKLRGKERCCWEHLGEHDENVIGNSWKHVENILGEHIGNMVGTPISKKIDSHNLLPFTPLPPRGKKWVLLYMLNNEVSFLKSFSPFLAPY